MTDDQSRFASRSQLLAHLRGGVTVQATASSGGDSLASDGSSADPPGQRSQRCSVPYSAAASRTFAASDGRGAGLENADVSPSGHRCGGRAARGAADVDSLTDSAERARDAEGSTSVSGLRAVRLSAPAVADVRDDAGAAPPATDDPRVRRRLRGKQRHPRWAAAGKCDTIQEALMAAALRAEHPPTLPRDGQGPG